MQYSGEGAVPDYPMALSGLRHMSKDELQDLLNDESKFEEYVQNLDQIKTLYNEKEMLMTSNKSLAEYNLSQEQVLKSKRETLSQKYWEASELAEKLKRTRAVLEEKSNSYKPEVLYSILQVANSEAEKESEQVADDFLSSKIENVDEFLELFMEKRKQYHSRNVKMNKMKELIEKKPATPVRAAPAPPAPTVRANNFSQAGYAQPASGQWGGPHLPYPLHPAGVPQIPSSFK